MDILGLTDWTLGEVTQSSDHLTDTDIVVNTISMSDRIADLTDAAGNNLGITDGQIYVYQDGTRSTINIDTNDTLETLAAKLSQYGITVGISQEGRLYFDGNNDSYLTTNGLSSANASNILSKLNIEGNWSTRYDSTSGKLTYEEEVVNVVDRSTKLTDLKDAAGNDLNITEGTYYVYSNGVRNTETITADTTVNDFMATLAKYGLIADIAEDGSISVGAYNNTYLATSALAGQNSNVVSTLFAEWDFVNIYTSNGLDIPTDEIRAINRDTKLADINEGTYQAGYITVVKDGVQTNIELKADDTVGTLMDELALYGFESVINEDGQLIIKNSGDSLLQNYTGSGQASNALTLLGIGVNDWISTNTYKSGTLSVVQTSTLDASATRDTSRKPPCGSIYSLGFLSVRTIRIVSAIPSSIFFSFTGTTINCSCSSMSGFRYGLILDLKYSNAVSSPGMHSDFPSRYSIFIFFRSFLTASVQSRIILSRYSPCFFRCADNIFGTGSN